MVEADDSGAPSSAKIALELPQTVLFPLVLQECKPSEPRRPIVSRVCTPIYGTNYGLGEIKGAREKKQPCGWYHARSTRRFLICLKRLSHRSTLSNG